MGEHDDLLKTLDEVDSLPDEEKVDFWSYEDAPEIIQKAEKKGMISSGLQNLDAILDGFEPGELVTVTAPTGIGKTSLCQTVTKSLVEDGVPSLWFTLEVSLANFLRPFVDNDEKAIMTDGKVSKVSNLPIYFPKKLEQLSFIGLQSFIRQAQVKYGVKCVFIDHLHYLVRLHNKRHTTENFSLVLGDRVRELKRIALETGTVIFLVAHMAKTEDGKRPSLNDIRDSSFVAQESDSVIVLWRERRKTPIIETLPDGSEYEETYLPFTELAVDKARRSGRRGQLTLSFDNGLYKIATKLEKDMVNLDNV